MMNKVGLNQVQMKIIIKIANTAFLAVFLAGRLMAQQVGINADGSDPDPSAGLDVKYSDKGVLVPRMTQAQIADVQSPADGLIVYCTSDKKIYIFDGSVSIWKAVEFGTATISPNTTWNCGQSFTDARDGKTYTTVQIGSQCWMRQNLNVGIRINGSAGQSDNNIIEKFCYDDLESNCDEYGALYHWDEYMNYTSSSSSNPSGRQGICPTGWHVPSDAELTQLVGLLGGTDVAGSKMKETDTIHWWPPNSDATNSSGFTARGLGQADVNGNFSYFKSVLGIWSSTNSSSTWSWYRSLAYSYMNCYRYSAPVKEGKGARCVKD